MPRFGGIFLVEFKGLFLRAFRSHFSLVMIIFALISKTVERYRKFVEKHEKVIKFQKSHENLT